MGCEDVPPLYGQWKKCKFLEIESILVGEHLSQFDHEQNLLLKLL